MKKDTPQTVKFKLLKRRLDLTHWQAIGLLQSIWHCTEVNAIDGAIGKCSDEEIAAFIEWFDDPSEMIEALVETKFLDRCAKHRLIVHDWHIHAPKYIKGAISTRVKSGGDGWAVDTYLEIEPGYSPPSEPEPGLTEGLKPIPKSGLEPSCKSTLEGATYPSLVYPSLVQSKKESSELSEVAPSEPVSEFEFPVVGDKRKRTWALSESKLGEYLESYPGVDVRSELRKARQYVRDNPRKRKTAGGMPRYLSSWLGRVQDRGGSSSINGKPMNGTHSAHEQRKATIASRLLGNTND